MGRGKILMFLLPLIYYVLLVVNIFVIVSQTPRSDVRSIILAIVHISSVNLPRPLVYKFISTVEWNPVML